MSTFGEVVGFRGKAPDGIFKGKALKLLKGLNNMDDRIRKLIRIVIVLIGIGILVYPSLSEFLMERNSSRAIAVYDDTVSKMQAEKINALFEEAESYNKRLAVSTGYEKPPVNAEGKPITPESYHSILNLENNGMMGYITIPKINETIRIFHGTEEAVLQVGAGHLESTSFPVGGADTHAVLSGHRGLPSANLFTDLDRLEKGDVFYIKILNRTFCYKIDRIVTVLPNDTTELAIQKGKDYVTLVTCTPYGVNSHRLLVRGERTDFDETQDIPVYHSTVELGTFWSRLPVQYRHMLIGVGAIIVFLILWTLGKFIIRTVKKRRES